MDIFKIEKHFKPVKSIHRRELVAHLNGLKNYTFSKKGTDLSGTFTRGTDFFKLPFSTLLRTKFKFEKDKLIGFKIAPNLLGKFILISYLLIGIYLLIKAILQSELQHQLGMGITGLGFLAGVFIVRSVLLRETKSIKKRLQLD
ncbi:hypothetical protein WIW50_04680 [Flavobacteriaceae bacterium 3-367]|uniref:hypothetical protein n=1 Tax=Eudoraea algarum TaxID=3417568 RepID=UPI0032793DE4